ncbi:replicative DNA helicase [Cupriavidus necator]|uniref:replicative DNA helicase n=1 Tax=Cupriavidus necator TaxID=106590 RepID=UPI00148FDA6A|nr:replicative DNA helicase [Cupriavidus necator]NOV25906.1 replicative DNA helicase [Cupriavidus necator]
MSNDDIRGAIPHSIEAEQSVLGGLLLDNDAIDRCGDLRAEHFYRGDHRAIYGEIQAAIIAGYAADAVTMFERLHAKGTDVDMAYLTSLSLNTPSSANIRRYADIIRDRAQKRGMLALSSDLQEMALNSAEAAAVLIDRAQGQLERLSEAVVKREPRLVSDLMAEHMDVIEQRSDGKVRVIPTGIDDLDRVLSGGIRPGNVVVLGARPSVGKTALAMSIAANVAERYSVLVLSMEMSAQEVNDRLIAMLGQIPLDEVLKANPDNNEMWQGVTRAVTRVSNELSIALDDQPALTMLEVRNKARTAKRKFGLDLLVLDYLQLMQGRDENEKRNYQLEEISRGVKALAKDLGIGVIELVQLNRGAEQRGGRYRMSDIRDCGGIEQDADVIGFLHRPIKDDPTLGDQWQRFAWLQMEKNRQGALADVPLSYIGEQTRFAGWHGAWPAQPGTARRGKGLVD